MSNFQFWKALFSAIMEIMIFAKWVIGIHMAAIPQKVIETIQQFLTKISTDIPIKKAVLFGSFAKVTFDQESDVDLAIFSEHFEKISRVEGTTYLFNTGTVIRY